MKLICCVKDADKSTGLLSTFLLLPDHSTTNAVFVLNGVPSLLTPWTST